MEFKQLEESILNCHKCNLYKTRKNPVVGEGSVNARIMFIGEAPGFNEDNSGKPFVGAAGKVLDKLLESIQLSREEIYITNVIKCRPPNNRNPSNEEIDLCTNYLNKQLEIINPKIICCLGNFATKFILEKFDLKNKINKITELHGKILKISNLKGDLKIIPMFHPAVATYNINKIDILKKDFETLKSELNKMNKTK